MKSSIITLIFLCCFSGLQAQTIERSSIVPAGESVAGPNTLLDWTLGEIAVQTRSTRSGLLTEGIQQPLLRVERVSPGIHNLKVAVFPNPAHNEVSVSLEGKPGVLFDYVLRDIAGRDLRHRTKLPAAARHRIDLATLPMGVYLLTVNANDGSLPQSFRILKAR